MYLFEFYIKNRSKEEERPGGMGYFLRRVESKRNNFLFKVKSKDGRINEENLQGIISSSLSKQATVMLFTI